MWDKSLACWGGGGGGYRKTDRHVDYDQLNNGITHLELHPGYDREMIRFDIFRLRCAITRRSMSRLRDCLLRTTPDIIDKLSEFLDFSFRLYIMLTFEI